MDRFRACVVHDTSVSSLKVDHWPAVLDEETGLFCTFSFGDRGYAERDGILLLLAKDSSRMQQLVWNKLEYGSRIERVGKGTSKLGKFAVLSSTRPPTKSKQ